MALPLRQDLLDQALAPGADHLPLAQVLDMHRNQVAGTIPPQISGMGSALQIYLQENALQGQIPETLGNLSSLQVSSKEVRCKR